MGLSASLWTSVSGLLAHGEKMNVVGNNLANVSTIGFKSQRMDFEDFIYKNQFTAGGTDQVGLGVGVNAIIGDFSQGAFELTNSATDLAIGGTGFFKVVNQATGGDYYTRAGNFNFDAEGFLTLPSGEVLQGWRVDNNTNPLPASGINPVVQENTGIKTVGEATDIRLNTWTILPKPTTKVEFSVNLTSELNNDRSVSVDNPLFAMSDVWNGKEAIDNDTSPLSSEAYEYSAPMKVYDEGGKEHTLTTYFDRVPTEDEDGNPIIKDLPTGFQVYEYLLTMNPEEDARTFGGTYDAATGTLTGATAFKDTEAAGILMKGTMIFNSSGELVSQTAYSYMGNTDFAPGQTVPFASPTLAEDDIIAATARAAIAEVGRTDAVTTAVEGNATITAGITTARDEAELIASVQAGIAAAEAAGETADTEVTDALAAAELAGAVGSYAYYKAYDDSLGVAGTGGAYALAYKAARDAFNADATKVDAAGDAGEAAYKDSTEYLKEYDTQARLVGTPEEIAKYEASFNNLKPSITAQLQLEADATVLGHPDNDASWQPTLMSDEGYPLFVANFSGQPMANAVGQSKAITDETRSKDANDIWIEFSLGLQSENPQSPWQTADGVGGLTEVTRVPAGTSSPSIADVLRTTPTTEETNVSYLELATLLPNSAKTGSSTSLDDSSYTSFGSQDGYPAGDLTNVNIDADGVVYGIYSNGVNLPLYQIAMYDFVNTQGLYREGGNLFSETLESGSIQEAKAGIAGMGTVNSYNIEQSNVDMTREFVQMIATQRGFQANSKGITTVDVMLEQVINMKR